MQKIFKKINNNINCSAILTTKTEKAQIYSIRHKKGDIITWAEIKRIMRLLNLFIDNFIIYEFKIENNLK